MHRLFHKLLEEKTEKHIWKRHNCASRFIELKSMIAKKKQNVSINYSTNLKKSRKKIFYNTYNNYTKHILKFIYCTIIYNEINLL